jgi:serine/threonine protein kinase
MQERLMRFSVYNHFKLPTMYYCAREQGLRVIVMQKLGPSLDKLLQLWRGKLPLKTVLLFAEQMLIILDCMHKIAIHGDIQPSNICLGVGSNNHLLHLIDFSLTIYFRSEVPPTPTEGFRGNHIFAAINTHNRLSSSNSSPT